MEAEERINFCMTLTGKTIVIELESLVNDEEETLEYAKRLFKNLENAVYQAKNHEIIEVSQSN